MSAWIHPTTKSIYKAEITDMSPSKIIEPEKAFYLYPETPPKDESGYFRFENWKKAYDKGWRKIRPNIKAKFPIALIALLLISSCGKKDPELEVSASMCIDHCIERNLNKVNGNKNDAYQMCVDLILPKSKCYTTDNNYFYYR